jgi:hypothetical protein
MISYLAVWDGRQHILLHCVLKPHQHMCHPRTISSISSMLGYKNDLTSSFMQGRSTSQTAAASAAVQRANDLRQWYLLMSSCKYSPSPVSRSTRACPNNHWRKWCPKEGARVMFIELHICREAELPVGPVSCSVRRSPPVMEVRVVETIGSATIQDEEDAVESQVHIIRASETDTHAGL